MAYLRKKKTRKLNLSGRNLDKIPSYVFKDRGITSLDLSNNNISEIPANISELTELRLLDLRNNNITQLHNGILKAKSLRYLYLYNNPMKYLPDFIKKKATYSVYTDNDVHHYYKKIEMEGKHRGLQENIGEEVDSICKHKTEFCHASVVPTATDTDITFSRHDDRKGKTMNTCVLFVDIRDSVQKNKDHRAETLAKMYSAFIYGVLRIAKAYKGHVRNIIGDRVMVAFDEDDCCDNAVGCAGSILHFSEKCMGTTLQNGTFRCGIGIHFGTVNVIEVGLKVLGKENTDYKNLIWMGEPANLASRLTDMAGKDGLPFIVISKDVHDKIKDKSLRLNFEHVDKKRFKDVDFSVYGCNLQIK